MESKRTPRQPTADRRLKFALAYFRSGNATSAATEAGYRGSRSSRARYGSLLLHHPDVLVELERLRKAATSKAILSRIEALELLTKIARFDYETILQGDQIDLCNAATCGALKLIESLKVREYTSKEGGVTVTKEIKAPCRLAALRQIAELEGWQKEPQNNDDNEMSGMTEAEIDALLAAEKAE